MVMAGMCLVPKPSTDQITTDRSQTRQNASSSNGYGTKPIEELKVGDRVLANNPELTSFERSTWQEPDWSDWIQLSLVMPKPDGSELNIELLRPEAWVLEQLSCSLETPADANVLKPESLGQGDCGLLLQQHSADQQRSSLLPLRPIFQELAVIDLLARATDLSPVLQVEMDLPELSISGPASVLDIQPVGNIQSGAGRVVTATFHHSSGEVMDLVIGDGEGQETIGTTSNHPFWSADREAYINAGELNLGEQVRTYSGDTKRIVNKLARPGPEPVYNLEVHAEHVYYVGQSGTLVHNTYPNERGVSSNDPWTKSGASAERLAELRGRFGDRFRNQLDAEAPSNRQVALATVKSVRRQVERIMKAEPAMQQLLKDGNFMLYGFIFDARVKSRLGLTSGKTSRVLGLRGTTAVVRPGGTYGKRGEYRMPDFQFDGVDGVEYWDLKPASFTWNQQFQDILDWTGIRPMQLGYNR